MSETSTDSSRFLAEIAVPLPVHSSFTYTCPMNLYERLAIGVRVLIPFGRRFLEGYVVGFPDSAPEQYELKEIRDVLDESPLFGDTDLVFYRWAANYYYYPLGQTISTALPSGLSGRHRQVVVLTERGRASAASESRSADESVLIRMLQSQQEVPLADINTKAGRAANSAALRTLEQQGIIEIRLQHGTAGARIRKERWFSARAGASQKKLSAKQKSILDYLTTHGPAALSALKEQFGNCAATLSALAARGLVSIEERELFRRPPDGNIVFHEPARTLSPGQQHIIDQIDPAITGGHFLPFLLYGVTGSGKTEIYFNAMDRVLEKGGQCLYLVPEIALTAQLLDRIRSRFTAPTAMLHSSLTAAERYDAWRMTKRGDVRIVVGARSAIFASFQSLGIIIIDEEHDPSYKQDEKMRYNARDLALVKGRHTNSVVILGSATPSLESFYNASTGKYTSGTLPARIENKPLPRVRLVDMRSLAIRKKGSILSRPLHAALAQRLENRQQSLLFLNRRGFAPSCICQQCGFAFTCPNCEVSLIVHRTRKQLCCHYCNLTRPLPQACDSCGSFFLTTLGWGTERLEGEIKNEFPDARVARMDRDTTARKGASRKILNDLAYGTIDILIGTQLIVKGYHLPRITLVGVVSADQSLNFPDYRASERTFQLLTQVAGRAGRGSEEGEVIIQTYNPDHYSIACARNHDFAAFYDTEIENRRELSYPPCSRLINIRMEGAVRKKVEECTKRLGALTRRVIEQGSFSDSITVLGPAPAPWEKMKGKFRYQMLVKGSQINELRAFVSQLLACGEGVFQDSGVKTAIDVDPLFVM